jgi:hypothetical protein
LPLLVHPNTSASKGEKNMPTTGSSTAHIRQGQSCAADAREAVREFHASVAQPDMAVVLFFCAPSYDREALADEMNRLFPGVLVVGCTTAGEVGPAGYRHGSLAGASFSGEAFVAEAGLIEQLQDFEIAAGHQFAEALLGRLSDRKPEGGTFAILLVDGLSRREEPVTHALQTGLGAVSMFGGSAGDGLDFGQTWLFHGGRFHSDSAVLLLLATPLPFQFLRTQHFIADGERLVVTQVDAPNRVVYEINGLPAADEYARLVGVNPAELTPGHFASCPVVVMIDGTDYVRSIQYANPDGSLTFYCAIDEGVVLRVAHGVDLLAKTETAFSRVEQELGDLEGMIVCDCILRNLEIQRLHRQDAATALFRRFRAFGFSTYGEQLGGVHINQTLTGIAIGRREKQHGQ